MPAADGFKMLTRPWRCTEPELKWYRRPSAPGSGCTPSLRGTTPLRGGGRHAHQL